ncbi:MAG: outer membrane protein transport protein [Gammaproteobacteria bacterium]|nr:outer membrane protein transport protein [Gammaproteobacteria bacterium]MCW9006082.1 outer membrane protein transport protein [Gammaproteobacteria bacterium]
MSIKYVDSSRLVLFAVSVLVFKSGFSAGFIIPESSVEGIALSDAMVANPDSAGAFTYNYSSMVFSDSDKVSLDLIGVSVDTTVSPLSPNIETAKVANQASDAVLPSVYLTQKITDQYSWGFHIGVPFGLETVWPADTFSEFLSVDTAVAAGGDIAGLHPLKSSLELVTISPSFGIKVNEQTAIAFGIDYYRVIKVEFNTVGSQTSGDGSEAGWNVSAQYKQNDWSVGVSYHSEVDIGLEGASNITGMGVVSAKTELGLPYRFQVGAGYQLSRSLYAEFDIERIGWSQYDQTVLQATGGVLPAGTVYSVTSNYWDDVTNYRAGVIYQLNDNSQLLLGAGYEEAAQKDAYFDATTADADRYMLSFGFVNKVDRLWLLKAAYQYAWIDDRAVNGQSYLNRVASSSGLDTDANGTDAYNGQYEGHIQMLSFGVSRSF